MKPSSFLLQTQLTPDAPKHFLRLANEFAAIWASVGLNLKPTRSGEPTEFNRASEATKRVATGYLEFNLAALREMIASGESLKDTKTYLWRAIRKLNVVPPSDCMTYINDTDIVEIYFIDDIQIFRNFRFLELTSFTIDEMLCRPWYRNTGRPWTAHLAVFRMAFRIKIGQIRKPTLWNIPEHELYEKDTEGCIRFRMQLKHVIPLFQQSSVIAVISTNSSHVIDHR